MLLLYSDIQLEQVHNAVMAQMVILNMQEIRYMALLWIRDTVKVLKSLKNVLP